MEAMEFGERERGEEEDGEVVAGWGIGLAWRLRWTVE